MVDKNFIGLSKPDITRFESYLPTAFSSELTLLQKVNKIIQDLNRSFDLTNEMVDYLNRFIETFDEKLYETIEDVLTVWLEDGRLADVVRVAINDEVILTRTDYLGHTYLTLKERLDNERKEVVLARDGEQTLGDRLTRDKTDTNAQLSQTMERRPHHYYVGRTPMKFTTIKAAYNQWVADLKPLGVIHVSEGEYLESLYVGYSPNLSFVGEGKDLVTWRTTTGYYKDAPLHFAGGLIKGITFIADITDNPTFAYVPLQNGNPLVDEIGSCYGLHTDFSGGSGKTVIEDCRMISYVNAGLGCGTKANQTVEIKRNEIISYTPSTIDDQVFSNGALLLKSEFGSNIKGQRMILHNNKVYSENGKAMQFLNQSQDNMCELNVEFQDNNFEIKNGTNLITFSSAYGLKMGATSFGNNADILNFLTVTDLNKVKTTSYFHAMGTASNIPIANVEWFGKSIAYYSNYIVHYAWKFTDTAQQYKRYCKDNVWSTWERCVDTLTETRDFFHLTIDGYASPKTVDANAIKTTCIAYCTTNTPSGGGALIQTISANANYGVQYGWVLTTGAKYKRTLLNGSWSVWVSVAE